MQMKMPKFQLAHLGCLFFLQSAQLLLPSNFTKLFSVCWFCAARSALGLGRLDMVVVVRECLQARRRLRPSDQNCCFSKSKDQIAAEYGRVKTKTDLDDQVQTDAIYKMLAIVRVLGPCTAHC